MNVKHDLVFTASQGQFDKVDAMLKDGADVNMRSTEGETALMAAAYFGETAVVKLLIDNNADASVQNPQGETALHNVIFGCFENNLMDMLINAGCGVDTLNNKSETALMQALKKSISNRFDASETIIHLVSRGASLLCADRDGLTPCDLILQDFEMPSNQKYISPELLYLAQSAQTKKVLHENLSSESCAQPRQAKL